MLGPLLGSAFQDGSELRDWALLLSAITGLICDVHTLGWYLPKLQSVQGIGRARAGVPQGRRLGSRPLAGLGGGEGGVDFFIRHAVSVDPPRNPGESAGAGVGGQGPSGPLKSRPPGPTTQRPLDPVQGSGAAACPRLTPPLLSLPQCEAFLSANLCCPASAASARWVGAAWPPFYRSHVAPASGPRPPAAKHLRVPLRCCPVMHSDHTS